MESNITLIKSLAIALLTELETVKTSDEILGEDSVFDLNEKVREFETKLIKIALLKAGGNQRRAARLLGLPTSTLNNKIKAYNIQYFKSSEVNVPYLRAAELSIH